MGSEQRELATLQSKGMLATLQSKGMLATLQSKGMLHRFRAMCICIAPE